MPPMRVIACGLLVAWPLLGCAQIQTAPAAGAPSAVGEKSMDDTIKKMQQMANHVFSSASKDLPKCTGPSCCPKSSCYSVPGLGCREGRGDTRCVGGGLPPLQKGECACLSGACNSMGVCPRSDGSTTAVAGSAATPSQQTSIFSPAPPVSAPVPAPAPTEAPTPPPASSTAGSNAPRPLPTSGWSRLYEEHAGVPIEPEDFTMQFCLIGVAFCAMTTLGVFAGLRCAARNRGGKDFQKLARAPLDAEVNVE